MIRRTLILAVALAGLWAAPAHAASWCGTEATDDRIPELFGGGQVHLVYVIPSDGTDRLAAVAPAMETDVESIDNWWRGQDPTRAPRFDLFPFSCGNQADIMTLKLPDSTASLTSPDVIFTRVADALLQAQIIPAFDGLAYYDGPATDPDICGIGSTTTSGSSGLAVVLFQACAGTFTDWTAAHEFGHSIGAVAIGAPHRCADSGHTCDNTSDLMYPFTTGNPLSSSILDPGRDDYYGHSGSWTDIQDSTYLKHLDAQVHLTVTVAGAGGGVVSDTPGVACAATCGTDWDAGAQVTLHPVAVKGRRLLRWTGDCTGTFECQLTLDASKSVTATFVAGAFTLTAGVTGRGTIASRPAGILCRPRCSHAFTSFVPVKLTAKPAKGWKLKTWSGSCHGKALGCTVPMKAASSAHATFVKKPKPKKH